MLDSPTWPAGETGDCSIVTGYWTMTHADGVRFTQVAFATFTVAA
jgi:hypothetical protein